MAILKFINNQYNDNEVFNRLANYILFHRTYDAYGNPAGYEPAHYYGGNNLFLGSSDGIIERISEQTLMTKNFYNIDSGQYLRHIILSFDSKETESYITPEKAYHIGCEICRKYFGQFQTVFAVHTDKPSHLHLHIIINTINLSTGMKLPYNRKDHYTLANFIEAEFFLNGCKIVYETPNY